LAFEKAPLPAISWSIFRWFPRVLAALLRELSRVAGNVVGTGRFLAVVEALADFSAVRQVWAGIAAGGLAVTSLWSDGLAFWD
jgi:hypothetical protein